MPSVDDRIVRIEFDNSSFERKVDATLHSLAQLDKALQLENAAKGFQSIDDAAKGVNLSSIAEGVDHIASRFSALGAIGFSVIQKLTQGVIGFGASVARKVGTDILEPIISGGKQRALNIEQAKFMFQGMGADVEKSMESARQAVLGTAYGLDEAAKTAAQLGASGIKAGDDMTGVLKGIAGVSAMTNTNFSEMADVFTQAAGAGKISGYTLERISYRGLNAAAVMAKQMHLTEAQVRDMASSGKIDFKTFADAMNKAFGSHAQEANKTYTGSLANLHAAMSRMGATVMAPRLEQMRDLFNAVTPQVDNLTKALKPLLDMFSALSRISINFLIKGIKSLNLSRLTAPAMYFAGAMNKIFILLNQIRSIATKAFKEVFPGDLMKKITSISKAIFEFTNKLKISSDTAKKIGSIFKGIFSILSIGWTIIKEGIKFIAGLVKSLLGLSGPGILSFFAKIGDFFTDLQKGLVKGKGITTFFTKLTSLLQAPIQWVRELAHWIGQLFSGFDLGKADKIVSSTGRVGKRFESLKDTIMTVYHAIQPVLKKIWDLFAKFGSEVGKALSAAFSGGNFNKILDLVNTGLLAGLVLLFRKFVTGGLKIHIDGISGMFNQLQSTLKSFQTQIKAETLKKIAIALGILTLSIIALSLIDSVALTKALTAMAVGFGQLIGVMALLDKIDIGAGTVAKFAVIAIGFTILAGAMTLLAAAAVKLGGLDWNGLAKGLLGTTVLLGLMLGVAKLIKQYKLDSSFVKMGVSLVILALALDLMASAVKKLGSMNMGDLAKGLLGVTVSIGLLVAAVKLLPKEDMLRTAVGLAAIAGSMLLIGVALRMFAGMDWVSLGKGFGSMAVGLGLLVGAMNLMPKAAMLETGAGLLMVSVGMLAIAKAMQMLGGLSWGELAKGLVAMAGSLLILAVAANAMQGAIVGAAAIAIVSASMLMLGAAVKMFGSLGIAQFITAIIMIAVAIGVLAAVAVGLSEAIPFIFLLGVALMTVGVAFALFGAGVYLAAKGFEALAKAGEKGSKALVASFKAIGEALPALIAGFAKGLLDLATLLLQGFGKLVPLIVKALGQLLDGLSQLIPKIAILAGKLIQAFLDVLVSYYSKIAEAGLQLIENFLTSIRDHIPEIVTLVGEIITGFLDALATEIPNIIASLVNLIQQVLTGVAEGVGQLAATLYIGMGASFISGFLEGLNQYLPGLTSWFTSLLGKILGWIGDTSSTLFGKGWDLISGLFKGIVDMATNVISWFANFAGNVLRWIGNVASTLFGKGWDLINGLFRGITNMASSVASWLGGFAGNALRWIGNLGSTLFNAGWDLLHGLYTGILNMWSAISDWVGGIPGRIAGLFGGAGTWLLDAGRKIVGGLKDGIVGAFGTVASALGSLKDKIVGWKGPPEDDAVLLYNNGSLIIQGLQKGMESEFTSVKKSIGVMTDYITETMSADVNPTITPVLDLTQVQAEAAKIPGYISPPTLTPTLAVNQARLIASDTNAQKAMLGEPTSPQGNQVIFNQTVNAPEQLSTSDIYKHTRNQIVMAKEELKIP